MLPIYFLVTWLAVVTSGVLLGVLWGMGDLSPAYASVLLLLFLIATYCQFFTRSSIGGLLGSLLQTLLAIYLVLRWKMAE